MTSRIVAEGNGAAGVIDYVTHDAPIDGKPQKTSTRVAGVAVRGLPLGCRPDLVARVMQSTITDAPWRKRRAGIPPGGRKLKHGIVHGALSWAMDQHPTVEEMFAAGDSWLVANGLEDHYTVMAIHREEGKPDHLHVVSCRVDPETGRAHRGNLATGGSRWAEEYERNHGGIRIPTRVERNRLRAEIRRLRKEARAAEAAGPTLMDRARRLVGAPDTVERISGQIGEIKSEMPPIETTRSAGRHRKRADDETRPIWNRLLNAQQEEREAQARLEPPAPREEVGQLLREQGLARKELARKLTQGNVAVDEAPRTRVPAPPVRTSLRPPRRKVVAAADPAEHAQATAWFRENKPTPAFGRSLAAAGYTPRRLEEALGVELAGPWAEAMRQYVARRGRPTNLSTLFERRADPVQRELKQEWFRLQEPTPAAGQAMLATGASLQELEHALGSETAKRYIAAAPRAGDLSKLFEADADPVQRELQEEWFRLHPPTEADAEAFFAAGYTPRLLHEALGSAIAPPWVEAVTRYLADAPPPGTRELIAALADPAQRERTTEWFRLNEPTEARLHAVVATGTDPALLNAVLWSAQADQPAGRDLADRWVPAVNGQYISEIGAVGVHKKEEAWDRKGDDWWPLAFPATRTNETPSTPTRARVHPAYFPTASARVPRGHRAAASRPQPSRPARSGPPMGRVESASTGTGASSQPQVGRAAAAKQPGRAQVRKSAPAPASRAAAPSAATPGETASVRKPAAAPPAPSRAAPPAPARATATVRTRETAAPSTGPDPERPAVAAKATANTPTPTPAAPARNVPTSGPLPPEPGPARQEEPTATRVPEPTPSSPAPSLPPRTATAPSAPEPRTPAPSAARRRPTGEPPTNEDLIEDLKTGDTAGQEWFRTHRPDRENCPKLVRKAVDPKLVAHVLPPEFAADWAARLEKTYAGLRRQLGRPVWDRYMSDWKGRRPEWEQLPTPTTPTQPDDPLAALASELQGEVLPHAGKLLALSDASLQQIKTAIDEQAGEPAAKELAKNLLDNLRKTSPYAPWQREDADRDRHVDAVNKEIQEFNARPLLKRLFARPPDTDSILKRIIPEAIAKLARAVVEFCRRALGLDRPPLPASRPSPPVPSREPKREPTRGR